MLTRKSPQHSEIFRWYNTYITTAPSSWHRGHNHEKQGTNHASLCPSDPSHQQQPAGTFKLVLAVNSPERSTPNIRQTQRHLTIPTPLNWSFITAEYSSPRFLRSLKWSWVHPHTGVEPLVLRSLVISNPDPYAAKASLSPNPCLFRHPVPPSLKRAWSPLFSIFPIWWGF